MKQSLIYTDHARLRMQQQQITDGEVEFAWQNGLLLPTPTTILFSKIRKYKSDQAFIEYWYARHIVLTVDAFDNVLVTVTRKKWGDLTHQQRNELKEALHIKQRRDILYP